MKPLWDRGESLDDLVFRYTAGEDALLDDRLVPYDIRASSAHAAMLRAGGYLDEADHSALQDALAALAEAHSRGDWHVGPEDEDVHTALENRLVAATGEAGKRIHLGRSRNDQVLAALRLWLKEELDRLAREADRLSDELTQLAGRSGHLPMPGYTHMQRAMPSTLGLWAGAFAAEIADDAEGLRAAKRRADKNPLGSAAGYGVPLLDLDRSHTTASLGFACTHEPVTAVQLSRGKAEASALFEVAMLTQDMGRLASDLCLFATAEFGFVRLPEQFTTGSSMLPQKRNPDLFELARGRAAESVSALMEVLCIVVKLPSGYNRDLQLTKKPLFKSFDSAHATARLLVHAVPKLSFDADRMAAAMEPGLYAAERAYRLVKEQGLPFREAYRLARKEDE